MRLTRFRIVAGRAGGAMFALVVLLGCSATVAFTLTDSEAEGQGRSGPLTSHTQPIHQHTEDIHRNSENKVASGSEESSRPSPNQVPESSSISQQSKSLSSSSSSSWSRSSMLSKRSLSSSSSSDTSFPRTHRHENDILNVAWPASAMWGFLPAHKKPSPQQQAPSSLHSQPAPVSSSSSTSSTSSFSKKASSSLLSSSSSSADDSLLGKKKSASSDLFLDPVTLDEGHQSSASFFSGRQRGANVGPANTNFFHSASSPFRGSASASSSSGAAQGAMPHATPPPRPHYILVEPPTRIEPPLGNDIPHAANVVNDDELESEILENEEDASSQEHGSEHSNWLKRSSPGVITKSASDVNKRTRSYDVPQIECPPADDGMERFACPSTDRFGRYRCVDDHVLCDGFIDCPGKEDEDLQACMFYKTTKAHLDVLADALLRWARGKR